MLTIPDVNVLVSAFRVDAIAHVTCREWLEQRLRSRDALGLPAIILSGFLRVVTHPRIFTNPSRIEKALDFTAGLLASAGVVTLTPTERHWAIFTDLCRSTQAQGNLVADAYLAGLAIDREAEFVTGDGDFARFPGLRWRRIP